MLFHGLPYLKFCKMNPKQVMKLKIETSNWNSYHGKNHNPGKIQFGDYSMRQCRFARAWGPCNANYTHVRPRWGVMFSFGNNVCHTGSNSLLWSGGLRCFDVQAKISSLHIQLSKWRIGWLWSKDNVVNRTNIARCILLIWTRGEVS